MVWFWEVGGDESKDTTLPVIFWSQLWMPTESELLHPQWDDASL